MYKRWTIEDRQALDALRAHLDTMFANVDPAERPKVQLYGRTGHIRRDALWYARPASDGMYPLYRTFRNAYGNPQTTAGIDAVPIPQHMPAWLETLLEELGARVGASLNHAVVHRYLNGDDFISPHHDKWMDLQPGAPIVSLSVGATRDFHVGEDTFEVNNGDVVALADETNRTMKHGIRPRKTRPGVRYSVTARCVDTHYDPTRRVFRCCGGGTCASY